MERFRSGGQALAPLRATRGDNPATAGGGHPRTEAVAAFANKPARLISAFHGTSPTGNCLFKRRPLYKSATEASQLAGYPVP
jgi:hypothetical protein